MFQEQDVLPYQQDGLIFEPSESPYNIRSDHLSLSQRVLTRVPDTCKWKPPTQLTIDFELKWTATPHGAALDLLVLGSDQSRVSFKGTDDYPCEWDVDINHALLKGQPTGTIVEFAWDGHTMVPQRVRTDKRIPNTLEQAQDNWRSIIRPITRDLLYGKTFDLMTNYHQRILNQRVEEHSARLVLDIGGYTVRSGRNIEDWSHYTRLIVGTGVPVKPWGSVPGAAEYCVKR